ncbi:MAG: glycosyltransferase [Armatimonadetes bacterium]|nr:glycosyltransferase [Armatimonadota bacterium]
MGQLSSVRVLIAVTGSHGDVLPFVKLGAECRRRGHEVFFAVNPYFKDAVTAAGLRLLPLGTEEDYLRITRDPRLMDSNQGLRVIARVLEDHYQNVYDLLERAVIPGQTVLIASSLSLAARTLEETQGLPTAVVHLSPCLIRSSHRVPRMDANFWILDHLPPRLNEVLWAILDFLLLDGIFLPGYNRFRRNLGLTPVRRMFGRWMHRATHVIGMFPDWFAPRQPDWPESLRLAGFPLATDPAGADLSPAVQSFLEEGAPPVVFTAGTGFARARGFYEQSAEACARSGLRGLLLTRHDDNLPRHLPRGVQAASFLPMQQLLPRAAALVHHAGIGTTSDALAAGVPQLVRPMAYDQFDNASRLVDLEIGRVLSTRTYTAETAAATLRELVENQELRRRCGAIAERLRTQERASAAACDWIVGAG